MQENSPKNITNEKRADERATRLRNYRVEIKFVGEPIYQFKVDNVSTKGAGLLIREDSAFLKMIEIGQIVDADFISPEGKEPVGKYKAEIKHITELDEQKYKGHRLVGISILKKMGNN